MGFRNELGAAQARADALERRVRELEAEKAALLAPDEAVPEPAPEPEPDVLRRRFRTGLATSMLGVAVALGAGGAIAMLAGNGPIAALAFASAAVMVGGFIALVNVVEIVPPGFVLVVSGRPHRGPDGRAIGYRVVTAGRTVRVPIMEHVDRLDVRPHGIEGRVRNAYSRSGEPLDANFAAVIRVSTRAPYLHDAIERFLGRDRAEVARVACETLEGQLRSLIAELTPEELRHDPEKVSNALIGGAEADFAKLGLVLESAQVERVEDAAAG